MTQAQRLALLSVLCLALFAPTTPLAADAAGEALERAAAHYRSRSRFSERLDYLVRFPDGRQERKSIEYGWTEDRRFLAMLDETGTRIFHIVVDEGALRATQFNVGGGYVESSFDGSLVATLAAIGADRIGIASPPGLAAFEAAAGAFVESFGFGVSKGLRPVGVESEDGETTVTLEAAAGGAVARLDAKSGQLIGLALTFGDAASTLRLEGTFSEIQVPPDDERWRVPIAGLRPAATFAELESKGYPLGRPVADLQIDSLDGETVSLASLRGRVVVLDFWATWCVPCWSALEHLERVAAWAETSGLPISVWAVDTSEQATTFAEQAELAARFLAERGLDLPVLVDVDGSFFTGLHTPGLPSTVLVAPDGTLARYHSGVGDDMEEVLRGEILQLLEDR